MAGSWKMKILLIQPNNIMRGVINLNGTEMPLNLLYLATAIEQYKEYINAFDDPAFTAFMNEGEPLDWKVEVLDLQISPNPIRDLRKKLSEFDPHIVGFTGLTIHANNIKILAKIVKAYNQKIFTIVGGIHVSALPEKTLHEINQIDLVVIGEGEITLLEICKTFQIFYGFLIKEGISEFITTKINLIKGIAYREANEIITTPPRPLIKNLDLIPFPNRDFIIDNRYHPIFVNYWKKPTTGILSSRGCPYNCSFCSKSVFQRSYRQRSPDNVIKEMVMLEEKYGIKDFRFFDDSVTMSKKWVVRFCYLLLKHKKKYHWNAFSRADTIDRSMLRLMKASGCYHLKFGLEAYSDELLSSLNKKYSKKKAVGLIKEAQRLGIETLTTFILNFPNESLKSMQQTVEFAKYINATYAMFFILKPLPGSKIYNEATQQHTLKHTDWSLYGEEDPPVLSNQIDSLNSHKILRKSYNQFYLRPTYIFARILDLIKHFSTYRILRYIKGILAILPSKK